MFENVQNVSIRDYFAAKAMHGIMTSWGPFQTKQIAQLASLAYDMADAMLKQRNEVRTKPDHPPEGGN